MKKTLAWLLAAVMCLSLVACDGGKTPNTDDNISTEQGKQNSTQQNTTTTTETDFEHLLTDGQWYYINSRVPWGLDFNADGTIRGGTWSIDGSYLNCVWQNETTSCFEIKQIGNTYFLIDHDVALTLYHYSTIDWKELSITSVELNAENWQQYLEISSVSTGEKTEYHLKVKDNYQKAIVADIGDYDSQFSICYSQGEQESVNKRIDFGPDNTFIKVENPDEISFELVTIEGTLHYIEGLQ